MAIDKQQVRKHFNRHAHEYDRYAVVQERMAEQLCAHMQTTGLAVQSVRSILEIGCGTGRLSERLLRLFPEAKLTALDLCENMIAEAQQRLVGAQAAGRTIEWMVADGEQWPLALGAQAASAGPFDLIVSNATFQWFNRPEQTLQAYIRLLSDDGVLAFSTFLPGTFAELHDSFARAFTARGEAQRKFGLSFVAGEQWRHLLAIDARTSEWREANEVLFYDSVWTFLDHVRRIGAGNAVTESDGKARYPGKQLLREMVTAYERCYGEMDEQGRLRVKVSYEVGYGILRGGSSA
jgi:malonyl-CoA O-methyltransferase